MRYTFISFLVVLCCFVGCSSDELTTYSVGDDFVDTNVQIQIIDTFSISAGTLKQDEIITSGTSRILLGSLEDAYIGNYSSQTFFQLKNSSSIIPDFAEYDSIGFVLSYDKDYYYGDTTAIQKYRIHEINQEFETDDDEDDNFYNNDTLIYKSIAIGELEFTPRIPMDTLYIPMDADFGQDLFDRINDGEIETDNDFIELYDGFTIESVATDDNNQILGYTFSTSDDGTSETALRLYFSVEGDDVEKESKYIEFFINSASTQFNHIDSDFNLTSDEYPDGLTDEEIIISSDDSDDLFFAQAGVGINAIIDIPSIRDLKKLYEFSTSLSAELVLYPKSDSYDEDTMPLPEYLNVYIVNHRNEIVSTLTDDEGSTVSAELNTNSLVFEDKYYYTINMNGFVPTIVNATEELDYSIMLEVPNTSRSVHKIVFEKNDDMKLSVTYLNY